MAVSSSGLNGCVIGKVSTYAAVPLMSSTLVGLAPIPMPAVVLAGLVGVLAAVGTRGA